MPLPSHSRYGAFDRAPPPLFRQGTSAFSRFIFLLALALFLMVADTRFGATAQVRSLLATALYPVQWLVSLPLAAAEYTAGYFKDAYTLQAAAARDRIRMTLLVERASQVEQLQIENHRLKQLLDLKIQTHTTSIPAQVLYDAADPHTRKIVVNKGLLSSVALGAPVLDEYGVIGQITRTHPATSEVTLLTDKDHAIPVLNTRTGARSVAYGDPMTLGGSLELRFMAANSDVLVGDLLTTSGVDGVYPAGIAVGHIAKIERRADSPFAKIYCTPVGKIDSATHILIINSPALAEVNTLLIKDSAMSSTKRIR
jgi:rod shape-determining protein MreC